MDTENALAARANRLYWTSEESVNGIADALDVSKGALYAMIEPRGAGIGCPSCDAQMEYANRTARQRGAPSCPSCGLEEGTDAEGEGLPRSTSRTGARSGVDSRAAGGAAPAVRPPSGGGPAERVVVGALLLAAAAGFVLGRLSKRR